MIGFLLALVASFARPPSPPTVLSPTERRAPDGVEEGRVRIRVEVDAAGEVTAVEVLDGPAELADVAREVGWNLRFDPARSDHGEPVAARAEVTLWFRFSEPTDADTVIEVHATRPDREDTRARATLTGAALDRRASADLAEVVSSVPGVVAAGGTADVSKPIIRGHVERRLLVLVDGIRHESQKWGVDHATEVDPFAAGTVGVVRGAAGSRYGPDAIGGVLLIEPPPLRWSGVGGKALASFSTNGLRPYGAGRVDVGVGDRVALRVEGDVGRGATLRAPDYLLGNTASAVYNLGAAVAARWDGGQVRLTWRRHDLRAGVFYGVQNSSPDAFRDGLDADRPVTADRWTRTFAIDRPLQAVTHDVVALHTSAFGAWGAVEGHVAFQLNHRQEFDQVRGSVEGAQYDFLLRTTSVEVNYRHPERWTGPARWTGAAGVQGSFQENVYRGLALIPNYRAFGGGVFAWERVSWPRGDLEVGARYDHLSRAAFLGRTDLERHQRRGTLGPGDCAPRGEVHRCPSGWDTGSVSVGGLVHVVPDRLDLKLDLSSASRFPNIDEQYMTGTAPSFPVYAVGDPSLGVETSWGGSATVGLRLPWLDAELSGFASWVDQLIYFAPERLSDGGLAIDVTSRGAWPRWSYRPVDATFGGADGVIHLGPTAPLGLDLSGAVVRARRVDTGEQLVGTPPDRMRATVVGRPPVGGAVRDARLALSTDVVGRQSRVDPDADFAPAPARYTLLGAEAELAVAAGPRTIRMGVVLTNALDVRYRDYTSLLRYYADQPGRDVRVWVGADL